MTYCFNIFCSYLTLQSLKGTVVGIFTSFFSPKHCKDVSLPNCFYHIILILEKSNSLCGLLYFFVQTLLSFIPYLCCFQPLNIITSCSEKPVSPHGSQHTSQYHHTRNNERKDRLIWLHNSNIKNFHIAMNIRGKVKR